MVMDHSSRYPLYDERYRHSFEGVGSHTHQTTSGHPEVRHTGSGFYPLYGRPYGDSLEGVGSHAPQIASDLPVWDTTGFYPLYRSPYGDPQEGVGSQTYEIIPDHSEVLGTGLLLVTFVKALGIRGDEVHLFGLRLGKADPYARLTVGRKDNITFPIYTTAKKDAGSDPVWGEILGVVIRQKHEDYNIVKIDLWNKNSSRRDTHLGEVCIKDLASHVAKYRNKESWHTVRLKKEEKGKLQLVFNFIPMSADEILQSYHVMESAAARYGRSAPVTTAGSQSRPQILQVALTAASVAIAAAAF